MCRHRFAAVWGQEARGNGRGGLAGAGGRAGVEVERKEGTGFERDFKVLSDQVVHWMGTEMKTSKASIDGSWVSGVQNWMDGNATY